MPALRAGWLTFRRLHVAALIADRRRTLLSAIGVALGVTVVLGTLMLKSELVRPFESFGPALTHAADSGVIEVSPNINGRLPIETVKRLRAEVTGADAVIPIVAALMPVDIAGNSHGFFLLGGSCQIELLVGPFDCEQRAHGVAPAAGPGVPLLWPLHDSAVRVPYAAYLAVLVVAVGVATWRIFRGTRQCDAPPAAAVAA